MTQLDKIEQLLSKHIENSNRQHTEMSVELATIKENLRSVENTFKEGKERMDKHEKDIEKLKWWRTAHVASVIAFVKSLM